VNGAIPADVSVELIGSSCPAEVVRGAR